MADAIRSTSATPHPFSAIIIGGLIVGVLAPMSAGFVYSPHKPIPIPPTIGRNDFAAKASLAAQLGSDLFAAQVAVSGSSDIPYPKGFRRWAHIKTVLVGPQSPFFQDAGGFHNIYANEKAMEGYSTGKFPDGSILIFDLLGTKEKEGAIAEGTRQRVDVMLKDSKQFSSTGGWGFERFLGDSETDRPLTEEQRKHCFTCHEQVKEHDFVFSVYRK